MPEQHRRCLDRRTSPACTFPAGPAAVLGALRGNRAARGPVDRAWCGGLREHLQDEVGALVGADDERAARIVGWRAVGGPFAAPPLADQLCRQLFRQWVTVRSVGEPLDDVLDALRAAGEADPLLRAVRRLDPPARRQLANRLQRHARWLERCWPAVDPRWAPVTAELRVVALAGGRVLVGARSDLTLGRPAGGRASRCLVAVTDGVPLAPEPWRRLQLAALAEALTTGAPPFRLVVVAPAAGSIATAPVDLSMLWSTAAAVVAAVGDMVASTALGPDRAGGSGVGGLGDGGLGDGGPGDGGSDVGAPGVGAPGDGGSSDGESAVGGWVERPGLPGPGGWRRGAAPVGTMAVAS